MGQFFILRSKVQQEHNTALHAKGDDKLQRVLEKTQGN